MFKFEVLQKAKDSRARLGKIHTSHGIIETPNFVPCGTQGTVKAMTPVMLKEAKVQIILANTYHLFLRPGTFVLNKAGGLHKFMDWDGPIITDSGGFQVFSLTDIRKISEEGVLFSSHIDGSKHMLTPEIVIEAQKVFGSDIILPLDECPPYPSKPHAVKEAVERTTRWAKRSKAVPVGEGSTLFGIVQGGTYEDLRIQSAKEISALEFPGFAIGGLSVNEPAELMYKMIDVQVPLLPEQTPKHLLGVGYVENIREAVKLGIDLFDCVVPSRLARHGGFLTVEGKKIIRNARFTSDMGPLEDGCDCYSCGHFSRAYIRHMFVAREILGTVLMTIHNLRFMMRLMEGIRNEIRS